MAKGASYDEIRRALDAQYALLVEAFAALDPSGPTDCAGWTVADLETHVAITARGLSLVAERRVNGPATGGVAEWAAVTPEVAAAADEAARTERLSLAPCAAAVAQALAEFPEDTVVEQVTSRNTAASWQRCWPPVTRAGRWRCGYRPSRRCSASRAPGTRAARRRTSWRPTPSPSCGWWRGGTSGPTSCATGGSARAASARTCRP